MPPALSDVPQVRPLALLPQPDAIVPLIRNTALATEVERLAAGVLRHQFQILGVEIETEAEVRWRKDYVSGIESGRRYFRLIPYLDAARAGDHKVVWELNRHQHLVLLAQAFLLTGCRQYVDEIRGQWESWVESNPYQRSINWASALEVAFRSLSWCWTYHLIGQSMDDGWRRRFLAELYRHGVHIRHNLSIYFSPNTHLLGEAVALHALGTWFPSFSHAEKWRETGARIVSQELQRQVRADGGHFEQSSYYHLYALDFFLLHYVLAGRPEELRPVLVRMAEYLDAIMDGAGAIPLIGDDDGGRVFHPYGRRVCFGRATLATCAVLFNRPDWLRSPEDLQVQAVWWLGAEALGIEPVPGRAPQSRLFPQTGTAILRSGELLAIVDVGGFGPFRAGHSHSDTLQVVVRAGDEEILIDPGTYTYVGDRRWRDWFRGSAAHNTVRIDGKDQAVAQGPFAWAGRPKTGMNNWASTAERDFLDAWCSYPVDSAEIMHRRRIILSKPDQVLYILDDIRGTGEHLVEQFWHTGSETKILSRNCFQIGSHARLVLAGNLETGLTVGGDHGWRSSVFGEKSSAPVIRSSCRSSLPVLLAAALVIGSEPEAIELALITEGDEVRLEVTGQRVLTVSIGPDIDQTTA